MPARDTKHSPTYAADQQKPSPPSASPLPLQPVVLDLRDPDDEPLGGEPPCLAPLLDDEGRVPDRPPTR